MILHGPDSISEVRAPAKLNLCLDVLGKRDDGYHELAMLMVPLRMADTICVAPQPAAPGHPGELSLEVLPGGRVETDSSVPSDARNLAYRAVARLRERAGIEAGATIRLVKRIPAEAGLGGGSSDAAAALVAAGAAWGLDWDRSRLARIAAEIGSDAPFFLHRRSAICRGRGEQVAPIHHATALDAVVAIPPERLSTAAVFRQLDRTTDKRFQEKPVESGLSPRVMSAVAALEDGRLAALGRALFNGLQNTACRLAESIDRLDAAFARLDVAGHAMTGSGSAYFGLCRGVRHARRVAAALRAQTNSWVFITQTCR
jgi:4-diphosphocytidyl-2-C-methyl-D-erythritol kinase